VFPTSFLRRRERRERTGDLRRFWSDWDEGTLNVDVAAKYGVDYVVSRTPAGGIVSCFKSGPYRVYRLGFTTR
jgi:hypothetical protein